MSQNRSRKSFNSPAEIFLELQIIARQADEQRLSVLWEQIQVEFPDFADHIEHCAQLQSSQSVIDYLADQNNAFVMLKYLPNVHETIDFIQRFFQSRKEIINVQ